LRNRVVVTGMAGISPLGSDWPTVRANLLAGRSGVRLQPSWALVEGLLTRLGGQVDGFVVPDRYPRKKTRAMGRVSQMATVATERALQEAGLLDHPCLQDGSSGIAYGSTSGSPPALEVYASQVLVKKTLKGVSPNEYIQFMSHTVPANLAQFFGVRGRIIPTCSACTSASQGIGFAFESIRNGSALCMLAGGAEELHVSDAAVFDILLATSTSNEEPIRAPRPFDVTRDGLVVSEGASTFVLEEREHALARGAKIQAEVLGFATNCDGQHITQPSAQGMEAVMRAALADAGIDASTVDFVSAHATGTAVGDLAESIATGSVFGRGVPIASLKGHMGHTLGACGAIESWMSLMMAREGWVAPTLHLTTPDPACADLDYVRGECRPLKLDVLMKNNFAFGGINTSILFATHG
jgi:3-oxoacyl-[acyl-carrier-protein] synthase II